VASVLIGTAASQATAAPATGQHYVALGDSYASGAVDFPQTDLLTCARSAVNYPTLVAAALHVATYTDATCAQATLGDLDGVKPGVVVGTSPPQLNALRPDTTLVTMTMGGNDIQLVTVARHCINVLPPPLGRSCAAAFTAGGHDELAARVAALAPVYSRALDEIHARAPKATIVLVGYPTISRPGGCPDAQPAWPQDVDYLRGVLHELNELIKTEAAEHHAFYVDTEASTVGHDMCAPRDQQWVNGVIPSLSTPSVFPLHPNTIGQQNLARRVLDALAQHHIDY
jgi:lysophospholipase L1-like esterase